MKKLLLHNFTTPKIKNRPVKAANRLSYKAIIKMKTKEYQSSVVIIYAQHFLKLFSRSSAQQSTNKKTGRQSNHQLMIMKISSVTKTFENIKDKTILNRIFIKDTHQEIAL